jgi:hypothetical protein
MKGRTGPVAPPCSATKFSSWEELPVQARNRGRPFNLTRPRCVGPGPDPSRALMKIPTASMVGIFRFRVRNRGEDLGQGQADGRLQLVRGHGRQQVQAGKERRRITQLLPVWRQPFPAAGKDARAETAVGTLVAHHRAASCRDHTDGRALGVGRHRAGLPGTEKATLVGVAFSRVGDRQESAVPGLASGASGRGINRPARRRHRRGHGPPIPPWARRATSGKRSPRRRVGRSPCSP